MKVITLDFDGVIVESNDIKDRAFSEIFRDYPEHYEKMMAYHLANNAVDRHEKFRYFVNEVLMVEDASLIKALSNRFSQVTRKSIIECAYVKGALPFLEYVCNKFPLYLVSATPEQELHAIIRARGLTKYFKAIFGAPQPKSATLQSIMNEENVSPYEMLFVGDSPEDQKTAAHLGIRFVGRRSDRKLNASCCVIVDDLYGLMNFLKESFENIGNVS